MVKKSTPKPRRLGTANVKRDRAAREAALVENLELLRAADRIEFIKVMELLAKLVARSERRGEEDLD